MINWFLAAGDFLETHNGAVTAIATIVIAAFTIILSIVTKRQAELTKTAADAAKKSADVAESALTDVERPYVFVEFGDAVFPELARTLSGKVQINFPQTTYQIRHKFINEGRAPAILTTLCHQICITEFGHMPNSIDPLVEAGERLPQGWAVGASKKAEFSIVMSVTADIGDVMKNEKSLFLLGYLRYADIFGRSHVTGFCCRYDVSTNRFMLTGDKRYNYTKTEKPEPPSETAQG